MGPGRQSGVCVCLNDKLTKCCSAGFLFQLRRAGIFDGRRDVGGRLHRHRDDCRNRLLLPDANPHFNAR
jgi:hypothetical protein